MKRLMITGMVSLFTLAGASSAIAGKSLVVPEPNSGEQVPIGAPNPIEEPPGAPATEPTDGPGPAPNSGDGVSDGSGF